MKNIGGFTNITKTQLQIDELKNKVGLFVDCMIKNSNNSSLLTISNPMCSFQIGTADSHTQMDKDAKANGISVIDFGPCETKLKSYYRIPSNMSLLVKKIDFNSLTNLANLNDTEASNSVTFDYFNPITRDKLNATICNGIATQISIPLKSASSLNMALYRNISDKVDIFNPESPAFTSRCISIKDPTTGADATLNYKREHYYNSTAECSSGCTYQGIDADNYMKCNCTSATTEIASTFKKTVMNMLPKMNLDIILCYKEAFALVTLIFIYLF